MTSRTKGAWLWSRDSFKILPFTAMQRVARVRQWQLSYLLHFTAMLARYMLSSYLRPSIRHTPVGINHNRFSGTAYKLQPTVIKFFWTYPTFIWRPCTALIRRDFTDIFGVRKESLSYRVALFAWSYV